MKAFDTLQEMLEYFPLIIYPNGQSYECKNISEFRDRLDETIKRNSVVPLTKGKTAEIVDNREIVFVKSEFGYFIARRSFDGVLLPIEDERYLNSMAEMLNDKPSLPSVEEEEIVKMSPDQLFDKYINPFVDHERCRVGKCGARENFKEILSALRQHRGWSDVVT